MQPALLNEILVIFAISAAVLYGCNRLRVPAVVGYLLTGVLAGPHGLGLVRDQATVKVLAEFGVVSLLFTIGLEFSFRNLLGIKRSVLLGGALQVLLTVAAVAFIAGASGSSAGASIFIGFVVSLSSTAIVMKIFQERAEVESPHGRAALGILIFQDIVVVPMMLLTPLLAGVPPGGEGSLLLLLAEEVAIILLVIAGAKWIIPFLFFRVARTKNRELFLLSVIVICLAVAWLTHAVGLSLALGAFLAGMVISESEYSHQALGNILPFRDVFTSFFFVSIGMLLDLGFIFRNPLLVLLIAATVLILKVLLAGAAAAFLGYPLRTTILVAMSLCQVGEFSFILSDAGTRYGLLTGDLYQVFLAVSVLTMMATPFVIAASPRLADMALKLPLPRKLKRGSYPVRQTRRAHEKDHLIIIGFGVNGRNLARAAEASGISFAVLEMNPDAVREEKKKGLPIYYGDATQEAVLEHVNIRSARAVVVVINDAPAARRITEIVRRVNPKVYLIVRTRFLQEMKPLLDLGADEVVPEEFETSVEIFSRVLAKYLLPKEEIEKFVSEVRSDGYGMLRSLSKEASSCLSIELCLPDVEITSLRVVGGSPAVGKTVGETQMRKKYGVTLLALRRGSETTSIPDPETKFQPNDLLFVVGQPEKIVEISKIFKVPSGALPAG